MASAYKLTQEIINFILEQKKHNQTLSCRSISNLIENKFQVPISKSTINKIIHDAGLSLPAGRRTVEEQKFVGAGLKPAPTETLLQYTAPPQLPISEPIVPPPVKKIEAFEGTTLGGPVLLKAADYLIGGTHSFNTLIDNKLGMADVDSAVLTEAVLYQSLFADESELWPLVGKKISLVDMVSYLNTLQETRELPYDINQTIPVLLQEARSVKIDLSDGNAIYLDGQFRTIWSTQYLPHNFSTTLYNIRGYINKYLYENIPYNLFMAPGNDFVSKDFLDFLAALDGSAKTISKMTIYGNNMEGIKTIPFQQQGEHFLIFGLWPWQFSNHRMIKKLGEFRPFVFAPTQTEFLIASIEIDLLQPIAKQEVSFRGCVLKAGATGKICMIILGNLPTDKLTPEYLATTYLSHWPNLIEAYQDFNRKVEFFTYVGSAYRDITPETVGLSPDTRDIKQVFAAYLQILDAYVKRNFLPAIYENADPAKIKEIFYDLKAILLKETDFISIAFQIPPGYPYNQDLEYVCRRLNEREIRFYNDVPVWFRATK